MAVTTYKVRLYPTAKQLDQLYKNLGTTRAIWNYFVDKFQTAKYTSYHDMAAELTQLKKTEEYSWLQESNSQSLQQTLKKLDLAYKAYFRTCKNKALRYGKPSFRSRNKHTDYFIVPQSAVLDRENKTLKLPKIGLINFKYNFKPNEVLHAVKQVVITKDRLDRIYACVVCDIMPAEQPAIRRSVGIDVNTANLLTDSDGKVVPAIHKDPRVRRLEYGIKALQARQSKCKKGSRLYKRIKHQLRAKWSKLTSIRNDVLHKTSHYYSQFRIIHMENLKNAKMTLNNKGTKENPNKDSKRKSRLNRVILANCWTMLREMIRYKASRAGNLLNLVDPAYTSQQCSYCGYTSKDNRRSQAVFCCVSCGHTANADHNAAINIRESLAY